jgi:hypothetical protein
MPQELKKEESTIQEDYDALTNLFEEAQIIKK